MPRRCPIEPLVTQRPMTAKEEEEFIAAFKQLIEELIRHELTSRANTAKKEERANSWAS